jgi:hypothetical protein
VDHAELVPREGWDDAFSAASQSVNDELLLDIPANRFDAEEWQWPTEW